MPENSPHSFVPFPMADGPKFLMFFQVFVLALVSSGRAFTPSERIRKRPHPSTALKYFDDVSRFSVDGNLDDDQGHDDSDRIDNDDSISRLLGSSDYRARDKSHDQVVRELNHWVEEKSDVVFTDDQQYTAMEGMTIFQSELLLDCLANLWYHLAETVNDRRLLKSTRVHFVVFPWCAELYSYETMFRFLFAVEMTVDVCHRLGNLALGILHPNYKNTKLLFSGERYSPYPIVGISKRHRQTKTSALNLLPPADPPNEGESPIVDQAIDVERAREKMEEIFQIEVEGKKLSEHLEEETVKPVTKVKKTSLDWIKKNKAGKGPFHFTEGMASRPCIVSESSSAEKAYSEIWREIARLYRAGEDVLSKRSRKNPDPYIILSSVYIPTQFGAYSYKDFKNFAFTVDVALKQLTDEKMYLEVFHPKLVEQNGKQSPYPMIQICYRVEKESEPARVN